MQLHRHTFVAMACANEVQIHAAEAAWAGRVIAAVESEVRRIEAKFSRYRDDSVITAINRGAGGAPVRIDGETAALLEYADACWRQSDGLFDITSGVLRRAWDFRHGILPEAGQLARLLACVGWERVRRDGNAIALEAGMELDFGGIGKEYAADRAAAAAHALGARHGLIDLGGDLRVIGPHPAGRPWLIGIADPRLPERVIANVPLAGGGLATSGDYERYFERDGKRYCHILDPRTGWPVEGARSVSVVAPLCTVAGSCATIAMLKANDAAGFLHAQGMPYLLIDRDGTLAGTLAGTAVAAAV